MLSLTLPKNQLAKHIFLLWFILAVASLAFSGIYSFLPYALRTPALGKLLNMQSLFNVSLMVHVNLGVLVWFLSSSAMLMTIIIKEIFAPISFTAFISSMIGAVFIIVSPFIGDSEPIKNDYIPILHNFTFILGISLFLSGILLQAILCLLSFDQIKNNLLNFTIYMSALTFIVAVICFIKSAIQLKIIAQTRFIDLLEYYQLLFWGSGHILQFNYVQLIVFAWLVFAFRLTPNLTIIKKSFFSLQWLNFLLIIPAIIIYWLYPLDSGELNNFFTLHMKYVGGILVTLIALWACYAIPIRSSKLEFTAFYSSVFLIMSGGLIGYLISGSNVTVPAHYHGVILGITVGLMGLFYLLLPELGFRKVNDKHASWQILLYTIGQFIHILALAISGGYGVLRKDPGTELSLKAKLFMGAMGIGGSIALIGGILFVVLIFKNMRKEKLYDY